jgi:hypothetical protein
MLVEMLTFMWALAVVLLIGTALLVGSVKMERAAAASYRRLTLHSELADQFRADVTRAVAAPERIDELTASRTCLILRIAEGQHVVYLWADGHLERSERTGPDVSRRPVPLGFEPEAVAFTRAGRDGSVVTLRLTEALGPTKVKRDVEIAAALAGDAP